ncbi:class I SAM-dependent methyltransferase [Asticcacaulis taihuensis]|uniref:class I SAM-dependent methyltransferase n=1 Tax=Asticcacaulis taihuensis TaxID=260084 RepID=UPI0026F13432|nr:class I SAM-dependent methyltransferase [Asticcacaulis taihuensis]
MAEEIAHVSDTAFWVAWYRWLETQRKNALFHDPLAGKLVGERGKRLARHMGIERAMAWSMALRTYIIDSYIMEAIAGGVDCVVNLGAGLDTRPYRLALAPDFLWIEVDFANIVTFKNETLATDQPLCRLERIACDLSQDADRETLLADVNTRGRNILVLTEGVIPYLTNEAVTALSKNLREQNYINHWITDYFSPFFLGLAARGAIVKQLQKNAPFRFNPGPEPDDWPRFFATNGWQIEAMRFIGEEGRKLDRDLPANWFMRMMMRYASEDRLRPYRRMNGYALLKKGHEMVSIDI